MKPQAALRIPDVLVIGFVPLLALCGPQLSSANHRGDQLVAGTATEPVAEVVQLRDASPGMPTGIALRHRAAARVGLDEPIADGPSIAHAVTRATKASCGVQTAGSIGPAAMAFGPKQIPYDQIGAGPWTGAYVNAGDLTRLRTMLPLAEQCGLRLIIKLAPSHASLLQPSTGCFDINLWKRAIDKLRPFDFAPYVASGTVIGAELVNEPHASDWCLREPRRLKKTEVEEMAAYAKAIWPTVPVGAGRSDWVLANAPWAHLDFAHSQYHMRKGDIVAWRDQTISEAKAAGVGHLMSLNFLAGQPDDSPMTATQLQYYGSALAKDTYSCMLTGYMYDATYDAGPGITHAFGVIAAIAASHPARPCYFKALK